MKRILLYILVFFICIFFISILFNRVNKKDTIAIIGAMDEEISEIYSNLKSIKTIQKNNFYISTGTFNGNNIILTKSGVGKVASATTTQYIIDKYKPKYIINIGIAGSLSNNLKIGDIVIAEKMVQHDFDVSAFGNPKGYIDNGIEPDKPTIFYSDKNLVDKFKKILTLNKNINIKTGTVATGDIFVNQNKQKTQIKKEFNADAIDMESAAIAQTAQRNNVPLIVIRTISDSNNDSIAEYKQNKNFSANKSAFIILSVLNKK